MTTVGTNYEIYKRTFLKQVKAQDMPYLREEQHKSRGATHTWNTSTEEAHQNHCSVIVLSIIAIIIICVGRGQGLRDVAREWGGGGGWGVGGALSLRVECLAGLVHVIIPPPQSGGRGQNAQRTTIWLHKYIDK